MQLNVNYGEILSRYERKGLVIKALKLLQVPRELKRKNTMQNIRKSHSLVN